MRLGWLLSLGAREQVPPPQKKPSFSWALFVKERILHFKLDDTLFQKYLFLCQYCHPCVFKINIIPHSSKHHKINRYPIQDQECQSHSRQDNTCMGLFEGGGRGGGGEMLVTLGMHSNQQMAVIHYIELWNFNITNLYITKSSV